MVSAGPGLRAILTVHDAGAPDGLTFKSCDGVALVIRWHLLSPAGFSGTTGLLILLARSHGQCWTRDACDLADSARYGPPDGLTFKSCDGVALVIRWHLLSPAGFSGTTGLLFFGQEPWSVLDQGCVRS